MSSQEKIISRVEALRFLTDSSKKGILVCNIAASRLILPSPTRFKRKYYKDSWLVKNMINMTFFTN